MSQSCSILSCPCTEESKAVFRVHMRPLFPFSDFMYLRERIGEVDNTLTSFIDMHDKTISYNSDNTSNLVVTRTQRRIFSRKRTRLSSIIL